MPSNSTRSDKGKQNPLVEEARRMSQERQKSYREKALKIHPWICARCGRDFRGKKLRELTVHHKDHNHDNNPSDGSNWELLCIYCHDNEHSRYLVEEWYNEGSTGSERLPTGTYKPFANLRDLMKDKT